MTFNFKEIPEIFRYCRRNNIVVDIDNILPRGRGYKNKFNPSDKKLKGMYETLAKIDKEEFGNGWEPTGSYAGPEACNRYCHHLFIAKNGEAHPCIGSVNIFLGNVKKLGLKQIWNSSEMKIIRERSYDGKCLDCKLFIENKCHSCLGRYTENLDKRNLLETGKGHTTGCFCFKEK
ncbi:MAG: SPASM domain-containing protein [Candidatus ainarchaeum sp.]|nr:SPASM domain-containing protein [Candidatus ainarchaeum sp.]